jgi:hypothetical protein
MVGGERRDVSGGGGGDRTRRNLVLIKYARKPRHAHARRSCVW